MIGGSADPGFNETPKKRQAFSRVCTNTAIFGLVFVNMHGSNLKRDSFS
jgi:hypothetical protein